MPAWVNGFPNTLYFLANIIRFLPFPVFFHLLLIDIQHVETTSGSIACYKEYTLNESGENLKIPLRKLCESYKPNLKD
jgi:hypothetical protein